MAPSATVQEHIDVISQVISLVDYHADLRTVKNATERMKARQTAREREAEDSRAALRALSRQLESSRAAATRPSTVPSQAAHSESLIQADATKFQLAKSINDEEGSVAQKEAEVGRLREELVRLEAWDPEGEWEVDSYAMRLKVMHDLGFEFVPGVEGRLLIRSDKDRTLHSYDYDPAKSKVQNVNEIWRLAGLTA
ncbi:hypothetical protein DACRYDRAFT_113744 [Dacryopinax primogenitus]|uniref:Kinetochore protein Spc24 n=1 Tax=Dacryopinax primogenitus (strain DJM 731) TaxID=1858805 RepID=M5GGL3_DACPD|nr:uncharacterized protein DACRYDRAFT_113744 [Dacryopinax primogenitus]EJU05688.1 hypothetical protein DACRYDRAFT_113744 [Dacryopinax primogenitus]